MRALAFEGVLPVAVVVGLVKRFPIWTAIGVFAIAGYVFRDHLPGNVADLRVGDCFDFEGNTLAGKTVEDVQHRPCGQPHVAEVIFVGRLADQSGVPSDESMEEFTRANCNPAFHQYAGTDYDTDTTYVMEYLHPLADGWAEGDRGLTCYVLRIDGNRLTGSIRVVGR